MLKDGRKKAVLMFWNYSFGQESMAAFKEGYAKGGGTIVKEIAVPFPTTEFQANLSEIAFLKPDAVFVFFAGAGAAKRSEEHTSELQSQSNLVCRLLLEKKKNTTSA